MIKKIICPTDFSDVASNAMNYAAKLAQTLNAQLTLVNIQRVGFPIGAVSLANPNDVNSDGEAQQAMQKLKNISLEINELYGIKVNYEVNVTTAALETVLASSGADEVMIVMGTDGIDNIYQYFFGTNTYNVIKNTNCPLLVIPEKLAYKEIKKVAFAWDYGTENKFSIQIIKDLMTSINPKFAFIHVSKAETEIGQDVYRALKAEVAALWKKDQDIEFNHIFSGDIAEAINNYMIKSPADLLTITHYNRGPIKDIFHGHVTRALIAISQKPTLVLHV